MKNQLEQAAHAIKSAKHIVAFTGAGISVESGIPPFRGEGGIWNTYDPEVLDLDYFFSHYSQSWKAIKAIFYDFLKDKKPNAAHHILSQWETNSHLNTIITQNIDNLHKEAGSVSVIEFHGNAQRLTCTDCEHLFEVRDWVFNEQAPFCPNCGGRLKPDFIFFGENIPDQAFHAAHQATWLCDLMLIIGASGEVSPANRIPEIAKSHGATIIEINPGETLYTKLITDIYLQGSAGKVLSDIDMALRQMKN